MIKARIIEVERNHKDISDLKEDLYTMKWGCIN